MSASVLSTLTEFIGTTLSFEVLLYRYSYAGQKFTESSSFDSDAHAKTHIYSLSLIFRLWDYRHYRNESYRKDMADNLKNVCIPHTGLPLSIICVHWIVAYLFVSICYPIISFIAAWNNALLDNNDRNDFAVFFANVYKHYIRHLLHPTDWFSLWRTNCNLIAYHAHVTQSKDYDNEDKWTFLVEGQRVGAPISPFLDIKAIVCKNKLIEGGMGIFFYKNACHGGDWIIQEALENSEWLQKLLPKVAPLSTMRIITSSNYTNNPDNDGGVKDNISAMTGVLRLGRANAATDHSAIFYNVNIDENSSETFSKITHGTVNAQWYKLGKAEVLSFPFWFWNNLINPTLKKFIWNENECGIQKPLNDVFKFHPDNSEALVVGMEIPDLKEAIEIVNKYHYVMLKDVPLVGWDVAFTSKGICLLEVNLSCNFFQGNVDMKNYVNFLQTHFKTLESMENSTARSTNAQKTD